MCGFIAIVNHKNALCKGKSDQALETLFHRGPDAGGSSTDEKSWYLGHRRLSIIDLSEKGNQPMWAANGKVGIVFNGEIYNYHELRDKFRGVVFQSQSDTEVILQGYIHEGIHFFQKLRGIYAFVLLDLRKGPELIAARDPSGVKPLYVHASESECIFGSEIKALKKAISKSLTPNIKVLQAFLQLGYCPEPETAYSEIDTVEPGHVWHWKEGNLQKRCFKPIVIHQHNTYTADYNLEKTADLLESAVKKNLISDVPCTLALSGGIDSSLLYYYAHKLDPDIMAITVAFKKDRKYDETDLSRKYVQFMGGRHQVLSMEMETGLTQLNAILNHFDQPFADTSAIPVYYLTKGSRSFSKVLIGGDGGDELFNGYPFMHLARSLFRLNKGQWMQPILKIAENTLRGTMGRKVSRIQQMMQYPLPDALINLNSWIPWNAQFCGKPILNFGQEESLSYIRSSFYEGSKTHPDDIITAFNFRQILRGDYLRKTDMMAMMNGVELRVPFLDEDLASFAMTIPFEQKSSVKKPKKILRKIHKQMYQGLGSNAHKSGFGIPLDVYLSAGDKEKMAQKVLSCTHPFMIHWVNPEYKQKICRTFKEGTKDRQLSRGGVYQNMVQLYALSLWLEEFE